MHNRVVTQTVKVFRPFPKGELFIEMKIRWDWGTAVKRSMPFYRFAARSNHRHQTKACLSYSWDDWDHDNETRNEILPLDDIRTRKEKG